MGQLALGVRTMFKETNVVVLAWHTPPCRVRTGFGPFGICVRDFSWVACAPDLPRDCTPLLPIHNDIWRMMRFTSFGASCILSSARSFFRILTYFRSLDFMFAWHAALLNTCGVFSALRNACGVLLACLVPSSRVTVHHSARRFSRASCLPPA